MKKKSFIFTVILISMIISILLLNSCAKTGQNQNEISLQEELEMNIIGNLGVSSAYLGYDTTVLSGAVEMAQLIGQFRINSVEHTGYTPGSDFPIFTYNATIEKIYFDRDGNLKEEQEITFVSHNGYIKAIDYIGDMANSARAAKHGLLDQDYEENDYFMSTWFNSIVYETDKIYLIFLCENENGDYIHASDEFIFEVDDNNLLQNAEKNKYGETLAKFEENLENAVINRKGELDQGLAAYFEKNNID